MQLAEPIEHAGWQRSQRLVVQVPGMDEEVRGSLVKTACICLRPIAGVSDSPACKTDISWCYDTYTLHVALNTEPAVHPRLRNS